MFKRPAHKQRKLGRRQRIYDFLSAHPVGLLSSVSPAGEPHGVVIYFAVNEQLDLLFLTRTRTRKYDNIMHNPQVVLTVFDPRSQTIAQAVGVAEQLHDTAAIDMTATMIMKKISHVMNDEIFAATLEAGPYVAFAIKPSQIRIATYAQPNPGEAIDIFDSIESFELHTE